MSHLLTQISALAGFYRGQGVNHEGERYFCELTLTPVLNGKAVQLHCLATGMHGEIFHEEYSTLALNDQEKLCLFNFNSNTPFLACHVLDEDDTAARDQFKLTFKYGDKNNLNSFREHVTLHRYQDGSISYFYAWGIPGGDFKERSGAQMFKIESNKQTRPDFIKNWQEIINDDNASYPGSTELLSQGTRLSRHLGVTKVGIHHELLKPGRRTSWPHAESHEDEFAFVVEGYPSVWIDGHLHQLEPGDAVGFPAGTGIAHTFINNTEQITRLIVVGEANKPENKCIYPLDPKRNEEIRDFFWTEAPPRELGPHDGLPDKLK